MTKGSCRRNFRAPRSEADIPLRSGDLLGAGHFYRNQEEVGVRFGDPNSGPSFKPKPEDWGWDDEDGQAGLSVNIESCLPEPHCSPCLHRKPAQFRFVVRIDLAALSTATAVQLVAKYSPTPASAEDPANPCHFDILPTAVSLDDALQVVREALRKMHDEPAKRPKPNNARDLEAASRRKAKLDAVFTAVPAHKELRTCTPIAASPAEQAAD
jgi:hypothetical protein